MCVEGVKSFFFAVSTPQARGFGRSPDTRQHRKASAVSGSDGVRQLHQLAENGCEQFGLGPLETGFPLRREWQTLEAARQGPQDPVKARRI